MVDFKMTRRVECMIYHSIENYILAIIYSILLYKAYELRKREGDNKRIQLITSKRGNESLRFLSFYFCEICCIIAEVFPLAFFPRKISVNTDSDARLRKQECDTSLLCYNNEFSMTLQY